MYSPLNLKLAISPRHTDFFEGLVLRKHYSLLGSLLPLDFSIIMNYDDIIHLCNRLHGFYSTLIYYLFFVFSFFFLEPNPRHVEVPRLGVELELQLPAYTTASATPDPSHICNLYHSAWPHQILNPLSEARDGTHILMDTSQVHYC